MSEIIDFSKYRPYNYDPTAPERDTLADVIAINPDSEESEVEPLTFTAEEFMADDFTLDETSRGTEGSILEYTPPTPEEITRQAYEQFGDSLPEEEIKAIALDAITNAIIGDPRRNRRLMYHPEEEKKY